MDYKLDTRDFHNLHTISITEIDYICLVWEMYQKWTNILQNDYTIKYQNALKPKNNLNQDNLLFFKSYPGY